MCGGRHSDFLHRKVAAETKQLVLRVLGPFAYHSFQSKTVNKVYPLIDKYQMRKSSFTEILCFAYYYV